MGLSMKGSTGPNKPLLPLFQPGTDLAQTFSLHQTKWKSILDPILKTGALGIQGATGLEGVTGPSGGPIGATGVPGIQGLTGIRGITGLSLAGTTGLIGATGLQGITGIGAGNGCIQQEYFDSDDTYPTQGYLLPGDIMTAVVGFPGNVNSICYWQFNVQPNFFIGQDILFSAIYTISTAAPGSIKLDLNYEVLQALGLSPVTGSATETFTPGSPTDEYQIITFNNLKIASSNVTASYQEVVCQLTRDVSVALNHPGTFELIGFLIHQ